MLQLVLGGGKDSLAMALAGTAQAINLPGFEREAHGAGAFLGLHVTVRADQAQAVDVEAVVERVEDSQG